MHIYIYIYIYCIIVYHITIYCVVCYYYVIRGKRGRAQPGPLTPGECINLTKGALINCDRVLTALGQRNRTRHWGIDIIITIITTQIITISITISITLGF